MPSSTKQATKAAQSPAKTFNLLAMLEAIDLSTVTCDAGQMEAEETAVGALSDYGKRLYALSHQLRAKANELTEELNQKSAAHELLHQQGDVNEDVCAAFAAEAQPLFEKAQMAQKQFKMISEIFWKTVRFENPELAEKSGIGVRENFVLVWRKEDDSPEGTFAILEELLSGGGGSLSSALFGLGEPSSSARRRR